MLLLALLPCLAACDNTDNYEGQAKVTFELDGGSYKNCTRPIVHYYKIEEGAKTTINEMTAYTDGIFERSGYVFEGWYKTKLSNGEYSNKWDFAKDKVDANGVTLYARWVLPVTYKYEIHYTCDDGTQGVLGSYEVSKGSRFIDRQSYIVAKEAEGYTEVERLDDEGNVWDEYFTHPGGDKDLTINVHVRFIKGSYTVVRTLDELRAASGDVYLYQDINCEGASFNLLNLAPETKIIGNNHKIYNFKISYNQSRSDLKEDEDGQRGCLFISLFGSLSDVEISNVTFDDVKVDIAIGNNDVQKVYLSPLCDTLTNSTLTNVKMNCEYTLSELNSLTADKVVVTNQPYRLQTDSKVTDCVVTSQQAEKQD